MHDHLLNGLLSDSPTSAAGSCGDRRRRSAYSSAWRNSDASVHVPWKVIHPGQLDRHFLSCDVKEHIRVPLSQTEAALPGRGMALNRHRAALPLHSLWAGRVPLPAFWRRTLQRGVWPLLLSWSWVLGHGWTGCPGFSLGEEVGRAAGWWELINHSVCVCA